MSYSIAQPSCNVYQNLAYEQLSIDQIQWKIYPVLWIGVKYS